MRTLLKGWLVAALVGAALAVVTPTASAQQFHTPYVPPRIVPTTVQTNPNYWVNGGYPNLQPFYGYGGAYNFNYIPPVVAPIYNPYPAYNPMYNAGYYNPYMYTGGGYGGGGGYGNPYLGTGNSTQVSTTQGGGGGTTISTTSVGDPYINPYVGYYNPYGGYLSGVADLVTARANSMVTYNRALLVQNEVFRSQLDTRRRVWEEARYERMNLMNSEQVRLSNIQSALDRARRDPPLPEIWSGQSLNDLYQFLASQQGKGVKGPTIPVGEDVLKHINLTTGKEGNVGLLYTIKNAGKISWPVALQDAAFDGTRSNLDKNIPDAIDAAKKNGRVSSGLVSDIKTDVQKMQDILKSRVSETTSSDWSEAKKYLNMLSEAARTLSDPNVGNYFNGKWAAQGKTVGELVENMSRNQGLQFAAATPGDEWAYRALYYAMAAYDAGMQQNVSSSRQP
jgi:hypothetical protein